MTFDPDWPWTVTKSQDIRIKYFEYGEFARKVYWVSVYFVQTPAALHRFVFYETHLLFLCKRVSVLKYTFISVLTNFLLTIDRSDVKDKVIHPRSCCHEDRLKWNARLHAAYNVQECHRQWIVSQTEIHVHLDIRQEWIHRRIHWFSSRFV